MVIVMSRIVAPVKETNDPRPKKGRGANAFTQGFVTRVVKGVANAKLEDGAKIEVLKDRMVILIGKPCESAPHEQSERYEIDKNGKIIRVASDVNEAGKANPWDEVLNAADKKRIA